MIYTQLYLGLCKLGLPRAVVWMKQLKIVTKSFFLVAVVVVVFIYLSQEYFSFLSTFDNSFPTFYVKYPQDKILNTVKKQWKTKFSHCLPKNPLRQSVLLARLISGHVSVSVLWVVFSCRMSKLKYLKNNNNKSNNYQTFIKSTLVLLRLISCGDHQ